MMSVNQESLSRRKSLTCWYSFAFLTTLYIKDVHAACPVVTEFNFGQILGQMPPKSFLDKTMENVNWLSGKWQSIEGYAMYSHIDDVNFTEIMEYQPYDAAPIYIHKSQAYINDDVKSHQQLGYLIVNPFNTTSVAKVIAHVQGINELSEGTVTGPRSLVLKSTAVDNMSFTIFTNVKKLERHLTLDDDGILESKIFMETELHPTMKQHIHAKYRKV